MKPASQICHASLEHAYDNFSVVFDVSKKNM